ncbi:MAG: dihydrofolate reductase [Candidatus Pacebacteria bacterium]|nr:dihydrofolate reductase [Candidatus Paceibacterota bacterium]
MISLIAAIGKNNELGKGNALLFSMPADMKHFRDTTRLHTVVMGRKTFESIGKPLPNRRNIVITRNVSYKQTGVEVAHSLAGALDLIKDLNEEIFIIGGAELYKETMPIADKLYITHVDATDKNADAFFPEIIPIAWNEIKHEEHKKDKENPFNYTFSIYEKFI